MDGSAILADFDDRPKLAKDLKVCERTIARYENEPDGLPSVTIGGRKYYKHEWVRDWLVRRKKTPNPRRSQSRERHAP